MNGRSILLRVVLPACLGAGVSGAVAEAGAGLVDHLTCFSAKGTLQFKATVDLDAVETELSKSGCRIGKARLLCTPSEKIVTASDVVTLDIEGEAQSTNKVCYQVRCPRGTAPPRVVTDQFGVHEIRSLRSRFLCVPGGSAECTVRGPEVCNGLDDDCDGSTDEDLGTTTCGVGACARTSDNCFAGQAQECQPLQPQAEDCNEVDDDCDGQIDEDFTALTVCGIGACMVTAPECRDGEWTLCCGDGDSNPGCVFEGTPASREVCDDVDNNCDGQNNEGLEGEILTCGLGACQQQVALCDNSTPGDCRPGEVGVEECNNDFPEGEEHLDENCNGLVDEPGCRCPVGWWDCDQNPHNGCETETQPGAEEVCDTGVDENCNGLVDEAGCTCPAGRLDCDQDPSNGCEAYEGAEEICDTAVDENCNGLVDEPGCTCPVGWFDCDQDSSNGCEVEGACP